MHNTSSKKIVFLIISLLIIFVSIVGVTYAFFTYKRTSETKLELIAGKLSMNYSEENSGISLENALPVSDENALSTDVTTNYFDFSVNYIVSTTAKMTYSVFVEDVTSQIDEVVNGNFTALDKEKVKIALKDLDSDSFVLDPVYLSSYTDNTVNGYSIFSKTVNGGSSNHYRLYVWIPELDANGEAINAISIANSNISLIVNVKAVASINK